jgi:hypothetical protein
MVLAACINDVLRTLTHIRDEFVSRWIASCWRRPGCDRQVVMMPPAVVPPKLVDVSVSSRIDDMLRFIEGKTSLSERFAPLRELPITSAGRFWSL